MLQLVRAVYKDGQLRPLEPLDLAEGQTVNLTITTELTNEEIVARMRAAGILAEIELDEDVEELTLEERDRIGRLFIGGRSSHEIIDEERGLY